RRALDLLHRVAEACGDLGVGVAEVELHVLGLGHLVAIANGAADLVGTVVDDADLGVVGADIAQREAATDPVNGVIGIAVAEIVGSAEGAGVGADAHALAGAQKVVLLEAGGEDQ